MAAFAHCCKHFPLFTRIPVYATGPVIALGRTLLQDLYASTPLAATTIPDSALNEASYSSQQIPSDFLLQPPTPEEIATYFSLIHALKYSQPHQPLGSPFSPPLNGLTITAYNSGHTLGGTIWHIQHGLESIVYAVDWNQGRENVFAGAAWLGGAGGGGAEVIEQLRKPTALVCSSRGGQKPSLSGGRAKRDEDLLEKVRSCITKGGTVLIPIDSSARVLELAYLMEHAWRADDDGQLKSAKLYLAGRNMHSTMRYARSMLEWMDDSIVREFEAVVDGAKGNKKTNGMSDAIRQGKDAGPFDFRHLRILDRKGQIDKALYPGPEIDRSVGKVILASDSSLEWGFSKQTLRNVAQDSRNMLILTEHPPLSSETRPSLARTLWTWWKTRLESGVSDEKGQELEISDAQKQALEGSDLSTYQQWLAQQRQLQTTLQSQGPTTLESSGDVGDDVSESSSESDDTDTEQQGKALNTATTMGQTSRKKAALTDADLGINVLLKRKGVYDFDVRNKKGRDRMFPHPVRRKRTDDYGELIRPEDFLRAEEREDGDVQDSDQAGKGDNQDNLGKKRKWDDAAASNKGQNAGANKRPQFKRNVSDEFETVLSDEPVPDELDAVPDDAEEAAPMGPSKLVITRETITVRLQIEFVDFAGIHDKRSLHMLIPLIQPRKLILIGGSRDETTALASDCRKLFSESEGSAIDIYTPGVGATVDASVDTNAWVVKLAPALVKQLKWQSVRGLSIATVTGRLVAMLKESSDASSLSNSNHKRLKTESPSASASASASPAPEEEEDAKTENQKKAQQLEVEAASTPAIVEPTLDVLPSNLVSATRSVAQPLHVGDLRLADLRRALQAAGHAAEFRGEGGTLLVDGSVVVRKSAAGRVDVESVGLPVLDGVGAGGAGGAGGGTFYAVKKTIYESLAVVAGA